jgi:ABC-type polysaccharide/polyol phosphate transport system ATPase subunit
VGILGSNGSGKSTLLKVLAGVLHPTAGTVSVNGSIASLIELGAGFDPELNAIENIYLHGSLHRKTRAQLKSRIDAILDFAELTEFAYTPVKYYSSGMFARLGFSAAVDIDPDILLVDEILSVGDERFKKKSNAVMKKFLDSGKTILMVSHSADVIEEICDSAILLSRGRIVVAGSPAEAISAYREQSYETALR